MRCRFKRSATRSFCEAHERDEIQCVQAERRRLRGALREARTRLLKIEKQVSRLERRADHLAGERENYVYALRAIVHFGHAPGCRTPGAAPIHMCACLRRSQYDIAADALNGR